MKPYVGILLTSLLLFGCSATQKEAEQDLRDQFEPLYTFLNPDLYNKLNQLMRTAVSLLPPVKSSGSFYPAN